MKYEAYFILHIQPMKMEQRECSETSANHNQTPGKYPKEYRQVSFVEFSTNLPEKDKASRIIGDPDNRRPDEWNSAVCFAPVLWKSNMSASKTHNNNNNLFNKNQTAVYTTYPFVHII